VIRRIGVVIPARDEERLIADCLDSVARAAAVVSVTVDVVVVADRCRDRTAAIARESGVELVELDAGAVGAARAAGALRALELGADWLAHTDADSVVPVNWLAEQRAAGDEGWDVVLGTIRPRFADLDQAQIEAWHAVHGRRERPGHVHGANLGVRAAAYRAAGGFAPLSEHEDVDLVARLRRIASVTASNAAEVVTSGRRWGRTAGGFARYLRDDLIRLAGADAHWMLPAGGAPLDAAAPGSRAS